MKNQQKGFTVTEIILAIALAGLLGGIGWYVYSQQSSTDENGTTSETATTVNSANSSTSQEDSKESVDKNEGYLVVEQWGLRFKVPPGLTDVRYSIDGDTLAFFAKPTGSTVEYRSNYEKTEDGNFMYSMEDLYRSTKSSRRNSYPLEEIKVKGKKVGDYYYYTTKSFSPLATGGGYKGTYGASKKDSDYIIKEYLKASPLLREKLLPSIELAQ